MLRAIWNALKGGDEYRFGRYGTFWYRFSIASWRWSLDLCKFEDHWALHLFCFWITLWKSRTEPDDIMESWGVSYMPYERCLHLSWGASYRIAYMPWSYSHRLREVMLRDGRFVPERDLLEPEPAETYRETFPYLYRLRSGMAQHRCATVTVERRTWTWRWCRWVRRVQTCIDVRFSDEVGEQTGSWKGGVLGCGYEMRPGETPEACLRRMESERVFG